MPASLRIKVFLTSSTTQTTVEVIRDAIVPVFLGLLVAHGLRCPSDDMKVGVSIPELVLHKSLLAGLLALDPRGGFFGQRNMTESIDLISKMEAIATAFAAWCTSGPQSLSHSTAVSKISYSIRVMLSHLRGKAHAFAKLENPDCASTHPPELQELYKLITPRDESTGSKPKVKIPCPFIYFRSDNEDVDIGESDMEDEEETIVVKSLIKDGASIKGRIRLSSGATEDADLYVDHEGFPTNVFGKWNPVSTRGPRKSCRENI